MLLSHFYHVLYFCPRWNWITPTGTIILQGWVSSVVCRLSSSVRPSPIFFNFKHGIISKCFELANWNFSWYLFMTWWVRFSSKIKIGPPNPPKTPRNGDYFKHGIISKRFELANWNFSWCLLMTWWARFSSRIKIGTPQTTPTTHPSHPETPNIKLWQFWSDLDEICWGGVI